MIANLSWSLATIASAVGSAFLLRGFVDGARAGDPEYYLFLGAALLGVIAVVCLELRLRKTN